MTDRIWVSFLHDLTREKKEVRSINSTLKKRNGRKLHFEVEEKEVNRKCAKKEDTKKKEKDLIFCVHLLLTVHVYYLIKLINYTKLDFYKYLEYIYLFMCDSVWLVS